MMNLKGKRIAVLVEKGFEDLEFFVPLMRLQEAGAEVIVTGVDPGRTVSSKSGGLQAVVEVDVASLKSEALDGIVIPGGWAPDHLRRYEAVKKLVQDMDRAGKIVAMICHAGSVGISAGIVEGHRATGSTGIQDDLENAGATWVDEAAFRDGNQVWGRVVADIPAFCRELVNALADS
jgi:protease I